MPEISAKETKASASAPMSGRRSGPFAALGGAAATGALATIVKPSHHMGPAARGERDDALLPRTPSAHPSSGGGADRGLLDLAVDVALELLEVLLEALGDVARGAVVGLLVLPGVLGVQHLTRHVRTGAGHLHAEVRIGRRTGGGQRAVERRAHHGAGVPDRHALADAEAAARP